MAAPWPRGSPAVSAPSTVASAEAAMTEATRGSGAVAAPVAALRVGILGSEANGPRGGVDLSIAGRRAYQGGVGVGAHWLSSHHVAACGGGSCRRGGDRDRGSPRRQQRGEVAEFHSHGSSW